MRSAHAYLLDGRGGSSQVFVRLKSPALVPVSVMPLMVEVVVPRFVSVTFLAITLPASWAPIFRYGGESFEVASVVGARVTYQAGDLKRNRMKVGGGSYLSSHDPRMVLGIGKRTKLNWLEVKWPQPSNELERFTDLPVDRYITIMEGQGKWK